MSVTARSDTLGAEDRRERGSAGAGRGAGPALAVFDGRPAAAPRTLLDVLDATVRAHPEQPALDDGRTALSYRALAAEVENLRARLAAAGIGAGDRVGVRVPSGTNDLCIGVLAVLAAGAAYVPVDAEDPDERAELVFAEAGVCAVLGAGGRLDPVGPRTARRRRGAGDRTAARPPRGRTARAARKPKAPTGRKARAHKSRPTGRALPPDSRAAATDRAAGTATAHGSPRTARPTRGRPLPEPAARLTARTVRAARRPVAPSCDRAPDPPEVTRPAHGRTGPRPEDDAWVIFTSGSTGQAQGRGRHPSECRRLRRRGGGPLPPGAADRAGRPGDGRPVGGVRRLVRGDVAGLAERRLPGAGAARAGPGGRRPRPVAGRAADHGGVHGADARRPVAPRGARRGAAAGLRRRGVPAGARRAAGRPTAGRCGTPTAPPRRRWSPARPCSPARARSGSDCPWTAGGLAVVDEAGAPVAMGGTGLLVIGGAGLGRYLDPALDAEKYAPLDVAGVGTGLPQR